MASAVDVLVAGRFGSAHQPTLVLGLSTGKKSSLELLAITTQGLTSLEGFSLSGPASNIVFGDFATRELISHFSPAGKYRSCVRNLQIAAVPIAGSVSAFALGSFVYDRGAGQQIPALTFDGGIQIVARNDFDPRVCTLDEVTVIRRARINHLSIPAFVPPPSFPTDWITVESFPRVGTISAGQPPVMFQTRISVSGADDVMWLNAGNGQMVVIFSDVQPGAQTFEPGQVSVKPYNGSRLAGLSLRINVDGHPGVIAIHQGEVAPSLSEPIPVCRCSAKLLEWASI